MWLARDKDSVLCRHTCNRTHTHMYTHRVTLFPPIYSFFPPSVLFIRGGFVNDKWHQTQNVDLDLIKLTHKGKKVLSHACVAMPQRVRHMTSCATVCVGGGKCQGYGYCLVLRPLRCEVGGVSLCACVCVRACVNAFRPELCTYV